MQLVFGEMDELVDFTDEMHLNSAGVGIIVCAVSPLIEIEISAQLAVNALQQVQIEFRSHAGAIVVSRFQHLPILF